MKSKNNNSELGTLTIGLMNMVRNDHLQTPENNQKGLGGLLQEVTRDLL